MPMKPKLFLLAALGLAGFAASADAATALYYPVSGADFQGDTTSTFAVHQGGAIANSSSFEPIFVHASLGGTTGGANHGFTVFGIGNGKEISCTILPIVVGNDGQVATFTGKITPNGKFSLFINTSVPASSGFMFYSIDCTLPGMNNGLKAQIFGVTPQR